MTVNWTQIPIIDLSTAALTENSEEEVAADIISAASTFGFLYIKQSEDDLSSQSLAQMFDLVYSPAEFVAISKHVIRFKKY